MCAGDGALRGDRHDRHQLAELGARHAVTAAGVLTGELVDARGAPVAIGSRLNIAGFLVRVPTIDVTVPRDITDR